MTTQKAYVHSYRAVPMETHTHYSVEFDHRPEKAATWRTREDAVRFYRTTLDGVDIKIPAFGDRVCRDFRVEERAPNEFVILCDYPA